jgi:hypothetical protein
MASLQIIINIALKKICHHTASEGPSLVACINGRDFRQQGQTRGTPRAQENDAKRARALRKAADERRQRDEKQRELDALACPRPSSNQAIQGCWLSEVPHFDPAWHWSLVACHHAEPALIPSSLDIPLSVIEFAPALVLSG